MSVTAARSEGEIVVTDNSQSPWPPLCLILKSLCCSPVCCSVSRQPRVAQGGAQSTLGMLQIMVGLLNIGLGAILFSTGRSGPHIDSGFPFWMGVLFMVFGILCILSEKFPSPCLIIITVILNMVGFAFAIAALAFYIISIRDIGVWWNCETVEHHDYYPTPPPIVPPEEQLIIIQQCEEGKALIQFLLRSIDAVLIVVSVLQICVSTSSVVLGIIAFESRRHGDNQSSKEVVKYYSSVDEGSGDPKA